MITLFTKKQVREHFNIASPYYRDLWGMHIHHGYYLTGKETKEEAQEALLKLIIKKLELKENSKVLDIGCGIGGTDIWLSKNYNCKTTGITIAPEQVKIAYDNVKKANLKIVPKFIVDDADNMTVKGIFDYAFAIEVLPHLHDEENFYKKISKLVRKGGRFAISDWFMDTNLSKERFDKYIKPINDGMMVDLLTPHDYMAYLTKNGFRIVSWTDLNPWVYKTWDVGSKLISKPTLWKLAAKHPHHLINFLKAFKSMQRGFSSGAFRYGIIIAEKT